MSSSQMGLMFPEGDRAAAEAPGGSSEPLANPCPPVLAREVLRFSLDLVVGVPRQAGCCFWGRLGGGGV